MMLIAFSAAAGPLDVVKPEQYNLEPKWEIGEHYCVIDEENAYGDAVRLPAGQSQVDTNL
jgi:hypothetical protein